MTGFVAVVDLETLREATQLRDSLEAALAGSKRKPALPDTLYLRVPGINRMTLPCRLRASQTDTGAAFIELLHPKTKRVKIDARMTASVETIMQQQRSGAGEVAIEVDTEVARAKRNELRAAGHSVYLMDTLRAVPARRILVRASGPVFPWREPTADELRAWVDERGLVRDDAVQAAGFTVLRFLASSDGLEAALKQRDTSSMLDLAIEQLAANASAKTVGKPDYQLTIDAIRRRDRRLDMAGGAKVPTILAQQLHTAPGRGGERLQVPSGEDIEPTMWTHDLHGDDFIREDPGGTFDRDDARSMEAMKALRSRANLAVQRGETVVQERYMGFEVRADLPRRTKRKAKRKGLEDPKQLVLWVTEAEQVTGRDLAKLEQRVKGPAADRWRSIHDAAATMLGDYGIETIAVSAAVFKLWREARDQNREVQAITVDVPTIARVLGHDLRAMNAKRREAIDRQLRLLTAMTLPIHVGNWKGKEWVWHGRMLQVEEYLRASDGETIYRLRPTERWADPKAFLWVPDELLQLDLGRQELEVRLGWIICREFARGYGSKVVGERDLRRRLDWLLTEAGDISIDRLVRDLGAAGAKARLVKAFAALESIGLDVTVEWNDEDLRASMCRPLVSERLALVHDQLAGKRLRQRRAELTGKVRKAGKAKPSHAPKES